MTVYRVTAIGDDWVELWDGETVIDPDLPKARYPSADRVFLGPDHGFRVGDKVLRLIKRVEEPVPSEETVPSEELWGELMEPGCDTPPDDGTVTP